MLLMTIAAAVVVGLTGYSYARLYGSGYGYMEAVRSSAAGESYLASAVEAARNQKYDQLSALSKSRSAIGNTGYYETVSVAGESLNANGVLSRKINIDIFYGNETNARYSSTVERTKYNALSNNLYQGVGNNVDGAMSAKAAYDSLILKKDAIKYSGNQVGDSNTPVYMDANGDVHAVDYFYRGNYNSTAKKILTYSGNNIDFINKDWIVANSAIVDSKKDANSGYIRYSNGTVFAWAKGTSTQAAGKHILVEKPMRFKTLQAYATDSNYLNETNYNRLVWWIPYSSMTKDAFMLNTAVAGTVDTFSVFWVGVVDKEDYVDIAVDVPLHQTITVTVTDAVSGEKTVLTNGYSGVFAKGSKFTASVVADPGYVAGKLNITSGTLSGDTMITASTAKLAYNDSFFLEMSNDGYYFGPAIDTTFTVPAGVTRIRVAMVSSGCYGGTDHSHGGEELCGYESQYGQGHEGRGTGWGEAIGANGCSVSNSRHKVQLTAHCRYHPSLDISSEGIGDSLISFDKGHTSAGIGFEKAWTAQRSNSSSYGLAHNGSNAAHGGAYLCRYMSVTPGEVFDVHLGGATRSSSGYVWISYGDGVEP